MAMTHPEIGGDGSRARIGLIIPSVNTVMEPWAARTLPEGISLHTARMYMPDQLTPEGVCAMDANEGMLAVRQLTNCWPAVVAYGCTASSMIQGMAYDAHLREEITEKTGAPATTAAHAILSAFKALGVKRIAAVSPYTKAVDDAEHKFFAAAGLEVVGGACLGITDNFGLAAPTSERILQLAREGWDPRAEALVITCLNLRSHTVIDDLERELGKPVITSTQATLWHALRLAGIEDRIQGYGKLLRDM
jgi:maleate isomerase